MDDERAVVTTCRIYIYLVDVPFYSVFSVSPSAFEE